MKIRVGIAALAALLVSGVFTCAGFAQQGVAEKVGGKLDDVGRGIKHEAVVITEAVKKKFEVVRTDVGRMGLPSRVYSRLHWDRALHTSKIEVHPLRDGGILLRGHVPDSAAKTRAAAIAMDTEGVTEVVDELVAINKTASTVGSGTTQGRVAK